MTASPEMEPRPVVGGFPEERVSSDNLPKGYEAVFQRRQLRLNKIYLEL